jgi:hypothetical protein
MVRYEVTVPARWGRWLAGDDGPLRGWGGARMPGEITCGDPDEDGEVVVTLDETAVLALRGLTGDKDGRIAGDHPGVLVLGGTERDRYLLEAIGGPVRDMRRW